MKQRIALLTGLTAVFLLILLTSCATPTIPEAIVETAVPSTPTPQPTTTTAPTITPEPTPTPTADEQANQRLLNNGRFTTLLDDLTQEIGRGLSDAEQAQVLALARALWLPGQRDESDWLPDPAGVTLHWRPALDGREGPVVRVVEAQPDSPYAAGALIFWQGERLLTLTPTQPGYYFDRGQINTNGWNFNAWIEYDAEGNVVRFVHPETGKYITPLSEDWHLYTVSQIDSQGNRVNDEFWWDNNGESILISSVPPDADDGQSLEDYLATKSKSIQAMTIDGQEYLVIIDAAGLQTEHRYNHDTDEWEVFEISAVNLGEAVEQLRTQGVNMIHESINLAPTDTLPGFSLGATERLYTDMEQIVAVATNEDVVRRGLQYVHDTNRTNNPEAPPGHSLYRTVNPVTGQLETTAVPHNATVNVNLVSGFDQIEPGLTPFYFGTSSNTTRYGLHYNEDTNSLDIVIQLSTTISTDAGVGSQPQALWEQVLAVFGSMTNSVTKLPAQGGNVTSVTEVQESLKVAFRNNNLPNPLVMSGVFFQSNTKNVFLQHDDIYIRDLLIELFGNQSPQNRNR
jgi:hypothetical protein